MAPTIPSAPHLLATVYSSVTSALSSLAPSSSNPRSTTPSSSTPRQDAPLDFHPSPADVASAREALLEKLPLELVDPILDFAEYWPRIVVSLAAKCSAQALHGNNNNCYKLILQTAPVPGRGDVEVRGRRPVRRIVFGIESKDQGWSSGSRVNKGTYVAGHSWFEAYLERPSSIDSKADIQNPEEPSNPIDISNDINTPRAASTAPGPIGGSRGLGWDLITIAGKRPWVVQRNVHAGQTLKKHTVTWNCDDEDAWAEDEEEWAGNSVRDGRGLGGRFVRALVPGDRVLLVARAQYPGWANHIENASIEVYYAV
ncbi:hypothetical protein RUND412_009376 [Rhizina undulata]